MTGEFRVAEPDDAGLLASIHAGCFEDSWRTASFRSLLDSAGVFGLLAPWNGEPLFVSFILVRAAADEAEILTLATLPAARGQGLASGLVMLAMDEARKRGALRLFLEAAETNRPALRLYEKLGFERLAMRTGYYDSRTSPAIAAVVMRRDLSR